MSRRAFLQTGIVIAVLVIAGKWAWGQNSQVAATVNGEQIPLSEVQKLLKKDRPSPLPLTQAQKKKIRKMALDMLIDDVLMRQFLTKAVGPISPQVVEAEMNKLKAALAKKAASQIKSNAKPITFQQFLIDTQQTEEQLRVELATRERWKIYVRRKLPDDLMRRYYRANKPFFDKIKVRARHILLQFPPNATASDRQVLRTKFQQIRQGILNKQITFAKAAKKYSDCPSRDKGGDIGLFPYKFAVAEPFARTAFKLQVGEISDLVETDYGFHLIQVTERTKGVPSQFENIKDTVRDVYAHEVQLYQRIIQDQRQKAKIEVFMK